MNHNDHKPDLSTLIEPELEARVVAWVSGEASPFEAAELTRLTNEKPELAIFKRRIEAVRGLVGEAIRPDQEPLRLAPERRAKLLQALGAPENKTTQVISTNTVVLPKVATKRKQRKDRRWLYALAACLAIGLFTVMSIPSFQITNSFKLGKSIYGENDRQKSVILELPTTIEPRSELVVADGWAQPKQQGKKSSDYKNREMAFQLAAADTATRTQERDAEASALSDRDAFGQKKAALQNEYLSRMKSISSETRQRRALPPQTGQAYAATTAPAAAPASESTAFNFQNQPTLAGSRVQTNLGDLTSNITVDTKQLVAETGTRSGNERLTFSAKSGTKEGLVFELVAGPPAPTDGYGYKNAPVVSGMVESHFPGRGLNEKSTLASTTGDADNIVLSPFTVEGKKDAGYLAKNTLTAGRDSQAGKEIDAISADLPLEKAKASAAPVQTFTEINASKEPVSTFSLHVSDVSFRLAQAALAKGETLDRASIRPEEFYNAFSYGDPTPAPAEKISCRIEQAAHPFVQQRNLVRIAVKVAASGRDAAQPLHLTVLLDTSGSMEREDRAATIQSAMKALTSLLGSNDRLTLIGFARQPRLLVESLPGDQTAQVLDIIKNTPAEGGTNLEEALKLGSELAHRQFEAGAQNRIVLLTDGAANLGNANPAQLAASVEALRQQGIAFDACGVGFDGLDDGMLENLTRKGDGRYYVLNSPEAADASFAKQLAGAFRPAAENVKLQVRFNPARVGNYRLIGFEQHRLKEEDFRNDKVDAAELASEEAAVAVYQVEALPQGEGELGEVYVRFRDAASGNMVERNWTLNYDPQAPAFDRAMPTMQLAGVAALLAEKLQGGEAANAVNLKDLAPVVNKLRSHYANEPRVQELVTMFEEALKLSGE